MKAFIRNIFVNFFCLFLIAKLFSAISYSDNFVTLFWAAACLTAFNLLIKPILNLLLMPINLLTLGAFRWIVNVVVLFLVTLFVTNFKITNFSFSGLTISGFVIPQIHFTFFWSLVLVSFLIEALNAFLNWIFK